MLGQTPRAILVVQAATRRARASVYLFIALSVYRCLHSRFYYTRLRTFHSGRVNSCWQQGCSSTADHTTKNITPWIHNELNFQLD